MLGELQLEQPARPLADSSHSFRLVHAPGAAAGSVEANGATLAAASNAALYALIGTNYGGCSQACRGQKPTQLCTLSRQPAW